MRQLTPLACMAVLLTWACGRLGEAPDLALRHPDAVRVFTGARVIVGDGAAFVVRDDLITQVGPAGKVEVSADAEVVDLTGYTVIPALVNTHAHLGWEKY